MNKSVVIVAIALFSFAVTGCRNTPIIPESPVISFRSDIEPILAANCQMSGCHGSSSGREGRTRPLDTYSNVISNGGIVAYQAHNSALYERVINAGGYNVMPPAQYNRLSQQQLLNIYLWIMQGANDN